MNDPTPIFDTLEPEMAQRLVRREALRRGAAGLAAVASGALALQAATRDAFAQDGAPSQQVIDVLNFALTLEYLEAEFYAKGNAASGLIPQRDRQIFRTIGEHERQHVAFLEQALGSKAVDRPKFDFTGGGAFDPFGDYDAFRLLAQAFEDTGVRAYKGQAILQAARPLLREPKILTAALTIHSVEARHAARVRQLRGLQPWIEFDQPDAPVAVKPVYATDETVAKEVPSFDVKTTKKYAIELTDLSDVGAKQITEAFDEPLGMDAVLAIAGLFIAS